MRGRGYSAEQAEGVVEVIVDAKDGLATKSDLRELHSDLALAMAQMEARFTRLLWLQLAAYTAATAALMGIALAIAAVLWG